MMPRIPKLSPYQKHRMAWSSCIKCPLHETRKNVVLVRGSLPCEILFIGEAPGASEDMFGKPFWGPAGDLLDDLMERAGVFAHKYAMTNLVGCIPIGDDGEKTKEPSKQSILACAPRLADLYAMARPKLVVCVGKLSEKWVPKAIPALAPLFSTGSVISITHPAAILRADVSQVALACQKVIVTLADALEDL